MQVSAWMIRMDHYSPDQRWRWSRRRCDVHTGEGRKEGEREGEGGGGGREGRAEREDWEE